MFEAGAWVLLESALADLPADLRWLFESGAVTLEQLARAARRARRDVRSGPGRRNPARERSGACRASTSEVEAAIARRSARTPRADSADSAGLRRCAIADPFLSRLRDLPGIEWAEPVGSLRRGQDTVGDIEILAPATRRHAEAFDPLLELPNISRCLHRGPRRLYVLTNRVQVGSPLPRTGRGRRDASAPDREPRALRGPPHSRAATRLGARTGRPRSRRRSDAAGGLGRGDLLGARTAVDSTGDSEWRRRDRGGPAQARCPRCVTRDATSAAISTCTPMFSDGRDTVEAMVNACRRARLRVPRDHRPFAALRLRRAISRSTA